MSDEYERLARWVEDDLADVDDPEIMAELDAVRRGLSVKQAFIEAFFPPDRVRAALAEVADPTANLRRRLSHREPLPTLDGLVVLAGDPSSRGLVERAAALSRAALDLYRTGEARAREVLGKTQIPGPDADRILEAQEPATVAVLADGRPYLLPAASGMSLEALRSALVWILDDAPSRAPSRPLGALTSATRPTCHALRAQLLSEPANARAIAAIEGAAFVLCLDSGSPPRSLERAACGLYGGRRNRWYGAPQIVVDAQGHAGVTMGYTRGHHAGQLFALGEALVSRTRDRAQRSPGGGPGEVVPLSLDCDDGDPVLGRAEAEAALAFHDQDPFFSLPVGWRWFQSRGLSPNAAIQYLMLLAAHDTWGGETPPTLTLGIGREGQPPSLDWLLAPTRGLGELRARWRDRACSDDELLRAFRAFAARLSARVEACKQGPCPSLLFSKPDHRLEEQLVPVFRRVAERHDSAYRGYLFRALREPWTIDLITSTLRTPRTVPYIGRPGATIRAASKSGLHILPRVESIDVIYIPSAEHAGDMARFHARLESWLGELGRLAAEGAP